jgi:hypothetical protein
MNVSRRTLSLLLIAGLAAAFVFGILVLASGDWLPGSIIVLASGVALVQQIGAVR